MFYRVEYILESLVEIGRCKTPGLYEFDYDLLGYFKNGVVSNRF